MLRLDVEIKILFLRGEGVAIHQKARQL